MRRLLHFAGWTLCLAAVTSVLAAEAANAPPAPAHDAEARAAEAFQRLYGSDLVRVRGTADLKDDVALAQRLLAAARQATGTPALLAVLCDTAYDLASGHPDGYAVALESAEFLASQAPARAALCAERVADVRQKQYAQASGEAKAAAGETLIDTLLALVDAHVAAGDHIQAVAACRKAAGIARAIESPRLPVVEARRRKATHLLQVQRDIRDMRALLERDPANKTARERLVRLYLVDLDDPAEAAKHLEGVEDEALKKYVPAAARGGDAAPELACVELGDWYRTLGETAAEGAKPAMFARANAYYERFLALHETEDLQRTTAALGIKKVEALLADLAPAPKPAAAETSSPEPASAPGGDVIKSGEWVELLSLAAFDRAVVSPKEGALVVRPEKDWGGFAVPVMPSENYRLVVDLERVAGESTLHIWLPVGSRAATLCANHGYTEYGGLADIDGKHVEHPQNPTRRPEYVFEVGKRARLEVEVRVSGEAAAVQARINGKPFVQWQGRQDSLTTDAGRKTCDGFRFITRQSTIAVHSIRLNVLSGEARVLQPMKP
ncbi:MAG: hypothetical protein ISS74_01930 [Planctomycetes bacterium]|nr:hypothetical protein [Planctomycetota bacterium]